jgi:phytoene synthase
MEGKGGAGMRMFFPQPAAKPALPRTSGLQLEAAYAVCRSISRASARNFYYSFLALPREKRDAICAVYAFMRRADDICDEPGPGSQERRERLSEWLDRLHAVVNGKATDDPVLLALSDAQGRYDISLERLDQLVAGTAMDLDPGPPAHDYPAVKRGMSGERVPAVLAVEPPVRQYETFADLYDYCYHVASVVGLICIRIFGYRNPEAEPLAERCGIAFQLTNILRDVKEDAAMGRIYLPREDLARFGLNAAELSADGSSADLTLRFRPLLEFESERAREFYRSAEALLPMIDEDSRPALWVLVTIYHRLLDKIVARNYDVFSERVRLTMPEKLRVLAKGLWLRLAPA